MATKTLRVTLADLLGKAGPTGRVHGEVWARFVDANGAPREVHYTDGTVVTIAQPRVSLDSNGVADFVVVPNDDASIVAADRGFGIQVGWDLTQRGAGGGKVSIVNTGKVVGITSASPDVSQYGLLDTFTPVIAGTTYVTQSTTDATYEPKLSTFRSPGSGDQTSALNSFLASASPLGVKQLVGTFNISSLVTIGNAGTTVDMTAAKITSSLATSTSVVVTAANVTIRGGEIVSPATFDGTNVQPTYAVLRATAAGLKVNGLTLTNVPKVGIYADDADDLSVVGCTIVGNYPAASYTGVETGHFGIAVNPGTSGRSGRTLITGNLIRSCVQGVFFGNYGATATGALGGTVTGNVFDGCHNHGVYNAGGVDGCTITGNSFSRCALPVALTGTAHTVSGNSLVTMGTGNGLDQVGISIREAVDCAISGNTIKGDAPTAAVIIDIANFTGSSVRGNVVANNTIDVTGGSSSAIRVGRTPQTTDCSDNIVANNTIRSNGNAGLGLITVQGGSGFGNKVTGNMVVVKGESHGIYVATVSHTTVQNNSVRFEYDAVTPVTLSASALSTDTTLTISSNANFPATPFTAILESEQVTVTASTSTTATVTRGVNSTTAAAHASGVYVRLPATKILGGVVMSATTYCTTAMNDIHIPATFGTNVNVRGVWEQGASSANRIIQNGYHGDLTKLTSLTPLVLITNSDAYLDERGIGAPTGAFFGAPGSRWSRQDGGTTTSLYVKETANTSATWAAK